MACRVIGSAGCLALVEGLAAAALPIHVHRVRRAQQFKPPDSCDDHSGVRFRLIFMVSLATLISGCGSTPQATGVQPDLADSVPVAAVSVSPTTSTTEPVAATTALATVPSTTAERISTVAIDEPCDQDRRLLEVAIEAYFAQNGEVPTAMDDLVGDYLREPVDSYALMPGGKLERQTGVPCRTGNVTSDEPAAIETVEDALALLGGDEFVAVVGGMECATEIALIVLAAQAYTEVNGTEPAELADLDDFLESPITGWVWQLESEILVPTPGSGCIAPFSEDDDPTRCNIERTTLEVASEAYRAQHDRYPRSQVDLLVEKMILEITPDFTVADGIVEPVPGSSCDIAGATAVTQPTQPTTTLPQPTYTLEVHSDGCGVFRSGDIGDDLTWVVKDLDGFQVLGRNAAAKRSTATSSPAPTPWCSRRGAAATT